MRWLKKLFQRRPERPEDVVPAKHVGAWVDNAREEDLLELPKMLLQLTDGELGNVHVRRDGACLVLSSERGSWKIPIHRWATRRFNGVSEESVEEEDVNMVDLADAINVALGEVGARGRLYNLMNGAFAYATIEQVEQLAVQGTLASAFEVPAERVKQFPLQAGTLARMHSNGRLEDGELGRSAVVEGITCAPGKIAVDQDGSLISCTLAVPHTFFGARIPAGSRAKFWSKDHPDEIQLSESVLIRGVEIPSGSTLHFYEAGGLARVDLGSELFFDGGRAEAGESLVYDETLGWHEDKDAPLWRPDHVSATDFDDADITNIDDLNRYYPLPDGFLYEEAKGRFYVRRLADQGLFSIELSGDILCFWETRYCARRQREVANNYEVLKVQAT